MDEQNNRLIDDAFFRATVLERLENQKAENAFLYEMLRNLESKVLPKEEITKWQIETAKKLDDMDEKMDEINEAKLTAIAIEISALKTKTALMSSLFGIVAGGIVSSILNFLM